MADMRAMRAEIIRRIEAGGPIPGLPIEALTGLLKALLSDKPLPTALQRQLETEMAAQPEKTEREVRDWLFDQFMGEAMHVYNQVGGDRIFDPPEGQA
jgi:hypothetical protein